MLPTKHRICVIVSSLLFAGIANLAQAGRSDAADPPLRDLAEQFARRNPGRAGEQRLSEALTATQQVAGGFIQASCGVEAYLRSLRTLAPVTAVASTKPADPKRKQAAKRDEPFREQRVQSACDIPAVAGFAPSQLAYEFGSRGLAALDAGNRALAAALRKGQVSAEALSLAHRAEQMLLGRLPETELCIASLQRDLDVLTAWDRFALLLESWRHVSRSRQESFYAALDRTAGTDEGLFFYDSMVADFSRRFGAAGMTEDTQRIQQAFLCYRRYRAFIEAVACSLVLPPDEGLPARLARYDYAAVGAGAYSLRHVIDILLEDQAGDVVAVAGHVRTVLLGLGEPRDIADAADPSAALNRCFESRIAEMVERSGASTDELGARNRARRKALAESIRAAAMQLTS